MLHQQLADVDPSRVLDRNALAGGWAHGERLNIMRSGLPDER
jgi:hypothetical protein